jgi:plastocyanin
VAFPARALAGVFACVLMLAVPALAGASVSDNLAPELADAPEVPHVDYAGVQHLHFQYGPIDIRPGQNNIDVARGDVPTPTVDGWITRIKPNLKRTDGTVPPVDVIHLHHAVWVNLSRPGQSSGGGFGPFFAAGEEKTIFQMPKGFGLRHRASDQWLFNYMIHNLTTERDKVYLTWDIDFVPDTAPGSKGMREVKPLWMDVRSGQVYPVFDVHRGAGQDGTFTYPDQDPNAYPGGRRRNEFAVDRDMVLVTTAGHLHPGGLHDDLWLTRPNAQAAPASVRAARCARAKARRARGATASARSVRRACAKPAVFGDTVHLFKSMAKYFEPAGAVSWDVAMTGTPPDWRVQVHRGDVLKINSTYDSQRASWYESMGIMVVYYAEGTGGKDPFTTKVDWPGRVTHGHLPENDNHGGESTGLPNPTMLPDGPLSAADSAVTIDNFVYSQGDLSGEGAAAPPVVHAGQSLAFVNNDGFPAFHTITACKEPCNRSTGIAYPLANGRVDFDSGELGLGGPPTANRTSWQTPSDLAPGTYAYFCRIHPFMRGSFRVVP